MKLRNILKFLIYSIACSWLFSFGGKTRVRDDLENSSSL